MLACKICMVSLVAALMLATTKGKNDADNKRNIGADIEYSNVKPSSPTAPLANSSKPAIFNMMKGFMNNSAKGSPRDPTIPYFVTDSNKLCSDGSRGKVVMDEHSCRDAGRLLGFGRFTRRINYYKYPSGCIVFLAGAMLTALNDHPYGLRSRGISQVCKKTGHRLLPSIPSTCDCDKPQDINECCCHDKDGDSCCTTECSLPGDEIRIPGKMIYVKAPVSGFYELSGAVSGTNADINISKGEVLKFDLDVGGHKFWIKTVQGKGTDNAVSSGISGVGQGKTSGVLIWDTAEIMEGEYFYQCQYHDSMFGIIIVAANNAGGNETIRCKPDCLRCNKHSECCSGYCNAYYRACGTCAGK